MGIYDSMNIGASAMSVHAKRLAISSMNMANIDTPNYIRKIPMIASTQNASFLSILDSMRTPMAPGAMPYATGGVAFTGIVEDPTLGEKIYKPGHPDADENGYIRTSNVNPLVEMSDATMSQRAYEASIAIVSISKAMAEKAVSMGQ
ncbi:flagellar basal body rod protein FlgC [bacterium]|nr:flagellar basal body rod protein FlgC [bacterium]